MARPPHSADSMFSVQSAATPPVAPRDVRSPPQPGVLQQSMRLVQARRDSHSEPQRTPEGTPEKTPVKTPVKTPLKTIDQPPADSRPAIPPQNLPLSPPS